MTMRQRRARFNRTTVMLVIHINSNHWLMGLPQDERDVFIAAALRRALKKAGAA